MPKTLSIGFSGPDVVLLQQKLNAAMPLAKPALNVDGQFGMKTFTRVKQFQTANGLVADGIVGPKTWAALMAASPSVLPPRTGCNCGVSDQSNAGMGEFIKHMYLQFAQLAASLGFGAFGPTAGTSIPGIGGTISPITAAQIAVVTPVYGSSLDFSTIYTTTLLGAGNRPFTVAAPDPTNGGFVQVMNLGATPSTPDLIHELMHCWQSQHASNPLAFIAAALGCQATAVARSGLASVLDPAVKTHTDSAGNIDYPIQYPYSAYAYLPGSDLDSYGAEQAANAVEHGDTTVCATVKAAAANTVIGKNSTSLGLLTAAGDRRVSGMIY